MGRTVALQCIAQLLTPYSPNHTTVEFELSAEICEWLRSKAVK